MKKEPKRLLIFFIFLLSIIATITILQRRRYLMIRVQDWLCGPQLGVRLEDI